ncbi:MAG: MaoC/PaaZ C-terminal domain-containing protein [Paracoccaceae bacterium]
MILAPGLYDFDQVAIGDCIATGSTTVTATMIAAFADLTGDRFEIHMSDQGAQRHGFSHQVAHGLLVLSLVDGLKNQSESQFRALASLGWDWAFRKPVFAGDVINVVLIVEGKRPTSNPARGVLTIGFTVANQHGAVVQKGTNRLMAYRSGAS